MENRNEGIDYPNSIPQTAMNMHRTCGRSAVIDSTVYFDTSSAGAKGPDNPRSFGHANSSA